MYSNASAPEERQERCRWFILRRVRGFCHDADPHRCREPWFRSAATLDWVWQSQIPARQLFFTVVTREEKYKAKNLVYVVAESGALTYCPGPDFRHPLQGLGLKLGGSCTLLFAGRRRVGGAFSWR